MRKHNTRGLQRGRQQWRLPDRVLHCALALLCVQLCAQGANAMPGKLARDEALRAEARDDATKIAELDSGTTVEVLGREGAWYRVDARGQQGWMRLYWVRTGGAVVQPVRAAPVRSISDSIAAARNRRNQNQITANLGVRGLSEEELKGAHFDAAQMAKLDTLAVAAADARSYAAAAPLSTATVVEVPAAAGRSGRSNRR